MLLSEVEENCIINIFIKKEVEDDFLVVVKYDDIKVKNYLLSVGQYFEVKIEYIDIIVEEFDVKLKGFESNLDKLFVESEILENEIQKNLKSLKYE